MEFNRRYINIAENLYMDNKEALHRHLRSVAPVLRKHVMAVKNFALAKSETCALKKIATSEISHSYEFEGQRVHTETFVQSATVYKIIILFTWERLRLNSSSVMTNLILCYSFKF